MNRTAVRIFFYTLTFDIGIVWGHAASSWEAALAVAIGFTITTLLLTLWENA